jgi:hypothetical protein
LNTFVPEARNDEEKCKCRKLRHLHLKSKDECD